jgi:hypothetical protein
MVWACTASPIELARMRALIFFMFISFFKLLKSRAFIGVFSNDWVQLNGVSVTNP